MLIPRPRTVTPGSGAFTIDVDTRVAAEPALESVRLYLQQVLRGSTRLPLRDAPDAEGGAADAPPPGRITLRLDPADLPDGPGGDRSEAFRLTVTPERIDIVGGAPAGVFYGVQALLQLLPPEVYRKGTIRTDGWSVPAIEVTDAPAFAWRGVMLDVCRNFRTKAEVLRVIDQLAAHRLNRLHFHLTEDQGWRIEIRRYPELTEVGAWRRESQVGAHVPGPDGTLVPGPGDGRPHGGYYTQDDIREIVAYAADRFVTVVPEIETPGHTRAAIAAYPELGVDPSERLDVWTEWGIAKDVINAEDSTIDFFRNVLDEVIELFPSPFIGIGGDECPRDQWRDDPRTQELMRERGFTEEAELQTWFMARLDQHITAHGRRSFGWDEILEGEVSSSTVVASWRGMTGAVAAARRGHDVVSCPDDQVYLDYRQSELPDEPIPVSIPLTLQDVYAFDPVPAELTQEESTRILGGQGNLWSEHMDSPRTLDYFAFPRLAALAEVLWSGPGRDFDDFTARLEAHLARLDAIGVEYRHSDGPRPWQTRPGIVGRPATREERAAYFAELVEAIAD